MLPPDALIAVDQLPVREALRRPLKPDQPPRWRVAGLLAGDYNQSGVRTVGDAVFQWACVEPEAFADADVGNLRWTSELVGAVGRLPKRFSVLREDRLVATPAAFDAVRDIGLDPGNGLAGAVRDYVHQQIIVRLFSAQGCEAALAGAEADPRQFVVNGIPAVVHDPDGSPPTKPGRLTVFIHKTMHLAYEIENNSLSSPLVLDPTILNSVLPDTGHMDLSFDHFADLCCYVNVAAQATRILWQRDTASIIQFATLARSGIAEQIRHVASNAAAIAAFGLTGPWAIVLARVAAGFKGQAVAKNLAQPSRYNRLYRREAVALENAVRRHCLASRDVIIANIRTANIRMRRFRELRANSTGPIKDCIEDWLDRGKIIQDYRQRQADRFHCAASKPSTLDTYHGDLIAAAQESLVQGGRAGLLLTNVTTTANDVVAALDKLNRKRLVFF